METMVRRVEYYRATVRDEPGEGYKLLSRLADLGINLLAFTAIPTGPRETQLTLFPEDPARMASVIARVGLKLDGPHKALMVHGDDRLGVMAALHEKLYQANVNLMASSGITDGKGCYGCVLYVRPDEFEKAAGALEAR